MKIALLNCSSATYDDAARIGDALRQYLAIVADKHDRRPSDVQFFKGEVIAPEGWRPLVMMNDGDTPGAIGYHDLDPHGRAYGRGFLNMIPGRVVLRDPSGAGASFAGVLSHEAAEMLGDENVNLYSDGPLFDPHTRKPHSLVAVELGDPVQAQAFTISVGAVQVDASNFVLPAWFSARCQGEQVDYLRQVSMPLVIAPGGYAIVRDATADRQVFARLLGKARAPRPKRVDHPTVPPAAWRDAMKALPGGRTARRLSVE